MKKEIPGWYPLGVLFVVASQAAFLTGISGVSESKGDVHATWVVSLGQVREAIFFAVVFGVVLYYGIPYSASKLELLNQEMERENE